MDTEFARRQMVRQQVRTWDVFEPGILALLDELPRDRFVPAQYAALAYADTQIPLAHHQVMMTPIVEGRLLQALNLTPEDKVLEIGTGSGFLTACLARLAHSVVSVEIFDDLLETAAENLKHADIDNVSLVSMDATSALPEGLFDAIAVTGSIPEIDMRYIDALRPGGRLFLIVGDAPVMEALLIERDEGGDWRTSELFETEMMPLLHSGRDSAFSF